MTPDQAYATAYADALRAGHHPGRARKIAREAAKRATRTPRKDEHR